MVELWAVIGLCCSDDTVTSEIEHAVKDNAGNTQKQMEAVQKITRHYCFRLSVYEVGEIVRYFRDPRYVEQLRTIYNLEWPDPPCYSRITFDPDHPFVPGEPKSDRDDEAYERRR